MIPPNILASLFGMGGPQGMAQPTVSPQMFQSLFGAAPQTGGFAVPPLRLSYALPAAPAPAADPAGGILGALGVAPRPEGGGGGNGGDQGHGAGGDAPDGTPGVGAGDNAGDTGGQGTGNGNSGNGGDSAAAMGRIITRVKGRAPKGSPDDGWITAQKGEAVLNRGATALLGPQRIQHLNMMGSGLLAPILGGRR